MTNPLDHETQPELISDKSTLNSKNILRVSGFVTALVLACGAKLGIDLYSNAKSIRNDINYRGLFNAFEENRHHGDNADSIPSHTTLFLIKKREELLTMLCPKGSITWHASGSGNVIDSIYCLSKFSYGEQEIDGMYNADVLLAQGKQFLSQNKEFQAQLQKFKGVSQYTPSSVKQEMYKDVNKLLTNYCEWHGGAIKPPSFPSSYVKSDISCILRKKFR